MGQSNCKVRPNFFRWLCGIGIVGAFVCQFGSANSVTRRFAKTIIPRQADLAEPVSRRSPPALRNDFETKKIEDIRLGDRVLGHNPELSTEDRHAAVSPTDDWRIVELAATKGNGGRIDIALLRSPAWFARNRIAVGKAISFDSVDNGSHGQAVVTQIRAGPKIERGNGHVVTGTFRHTADDLFDISVDGQQRPLSATGGHPFWNAGRARFVCARDLRVGESLATHSGRQVKITSILRQPNSAVVYNIEVHQEHVYYVSSLGLLVHNECHTRRSEINYGSIPDEHIWRYNRYLDDRTKGGLAADDWFALALRIWSNNTNGNAFEMQVRQALRSPLGKGSKSSVISGFVPDLPVGLDYGVTDIKDRVALSADDQLRAFSNFAFENELPFNLIISSRTEAMSEPLLDFIRESDGKVFQYDPQTGLFTTVQIGKKGFWRR